MKKPLCELMKDFFLSDDKNKIFVVDGIRISNGFIDKNNHYGIVNKKSLFFLYTNDIYLNNICLDDRTKKYISRYPYRALANISEYIKKTYIIDKQYNIIFNQPRLIKDEDNFQVKLKFI